MQDHNLLWVIVRWVAVALSLYWGWRKQNATVWILVSMVVGVAVGMEFPELGKELKVVSKVFLRLIKTVIAPLLFATLVYGIAGHSDLKQVGRMGVKSIIYFEVVTTLALVIGLLAINISGAGKGIALPASTDHEEIAVKSQSWQDVVLHIFPENLAKSVYEGEVLQIVVFSILFGIGVAMVGKQHQLRMVNFTESLAEVMFKFTEVIMKFAPFAVGAAIAYVVSQMGLEVLQNLFFLLITLYVALVVFLLTTLLPIGLLVKLPVKNFVQAIAEPVSLAFATTSSEAALPKAMRAMESLGVPRKVVAFVMPMGYSFNLDGTTLYLSLASVFVAQMAGIDLSWQQQVLMCFTLMLTSKGVAGVPRASLVILLGTCAAFGLPSEPVFVILGIDVLMDMARTSVNVIGNCLATYVIARWEGEVIDPNAVQLGDSEPAAH